MTPIFNRIRCLLMKTCASLGEGALQKKRKKNASSGVVGRTLLGFGEAEATKPNSRSLPWIEKLKQECLEGQRVLGVTKIVRRCHGNNTNCLSSSRPPFLPALHGLKLVDALLGVALADLTQGFVLVSSRLDVFGVQHVVLRFLGIIASFCQL